MKFIVVTQAFKAVGILRPNQLPKPREAADIDPDVAQGVDSGTALQSDTSADGVEFEFDAGTPHTVRHTQIHYIFNILCHRFPTLFLEYPLSCTFLYFPSTNTPTSTEEMLLINWYFKSGVLGAGKY